MISRNTAQRSGVTALAAYLSIALAVGCSSSSPGASPQASASKSARFVLAGNAGLSSDPFWISMMCGGSQAAKAAGATIDWKSFTTNTTAADTANVQAIQIMHPQGVIMSSPTTLQFESERQQWMTSGVPVVETNTVTNDSNFYKAVTAAPGPAAVQQFAQLIAKDVGDSGSFVVLGGQPGVPFLEAGWQPVVADLRKVDPHLTILPTQYDNFDTNKAASIVSGLLVSHPDLTAIYALTGPEATGTVAALRQAGEAGKIKVFSVSGSPDLVAGVRNGSVTALLGQSPYLMGYDAVQTLISYLKAHADGPKNVQHASPQAVSLPNFITTKANVDSPTAKKYYFLTTCP